MPPDAITFKKCNYRTENLDLIPKSFMMIERERESEREREREREICGSKRERGESTKRGKVNGVLHARCFK